MTETQRLLALNGKVGTKLKGVCQIENTVDVIEITAIGKETILARCVEKNGKPFNGHEAAWTLSMRDWKVLEDKQ